MSDWGIHTVTGVGADEATTSGGNCIGSGAGAIGLIDASRIRGTGAGTWSRGGRIIGPNQNHVPLRGWVAIMTN